MKPRQRHWGRATLRWLVASLYQVTVRAVVVLTTVLLFGYFTVNSPSVVARLGDLLAEVIPGRIGVRGLRWGPSPGSLVVTGLTLHDPSGALVLGADRLAVEVAWLPIVGDLIERQTVKQVRVIGLELDGLEVRLEESPSGTLRLLDALVRPKPEPEPPKPPQVFDLAIDDIRLRDGKVAMDLSGTQIHVRGLRLDGEFGLHVAGEASSFDWSARALRAADGKMLLDGLPAAGLEQLPGGAIAIDDAVGDGESTRMRGVRIDGATTKLERGDIFVRWAPALMVQVRNGVLQTQSPAEPFLRSMLGDLFDADARFEGDVDIDAQGRSTVRGKIQGRGRMAGFDTRAVEAEIQVQSPTVGGDPVDVEAKAIVVEAFGGTLRSDLMAYHLSADGWQTASGKVHLEAVSSAEALTAPAIGMDLAAALPMAATLDGDCVVDVRMRTGGERGLHLEARTDLDVTIGRDPRAVWLPEALPTLHLQGGIDTAMRPDAAPAQPLTIELREVRLSDRRDERGPKVGAPATWLRIDGTMDLAAMTLDAHGAGGLPRLGPLLQGFGVRGTDGALQIESWAASGPMLSPKVEARLRGKDLSSAGVRIDAIRTDLRLGGGKLRLGGVEAQLAQGRISGDLELDLYVGDLLHLRTPMRLQGRRVALRDLELSTLLGSFGVRDIGGRARVDRMDFAMTLDRPLQTFSGGGHLRVERLSARYEQFERAEADVRFAHGKVTVENLALIVPALERPGEPPLGLRGMISGDLTYSMIDGRWTADVYVPTLHFDQFGEVRKLNMPLRGRIDGRLVAEGDSRDLSIDGDLSVLYMRDLAWDAIVMGTGSVHIGKARGEAAALSSTAFFPRFRLLAGSAIVFRKLVPEVFSLLLDAERFDPWVLLGLPAMDGLRLWTAGKAEFRLDFRPGQPVFAVDALLPPGGVEIEMQNGLEPLRNRMPAPVRILPDRVEFDSTEILFGNQPLELCGAFYYPDATTGAPSRLALYLAGHVEVPRFGAIAESMASLDLGFDIGDDPMVRKDPGAACLHGPLSRVGAMRVAGPLDALQPRGRLVLTASRLVPRGYGREILLAAGARIDLSADDQGHLRVDIPAKAALEGRVDDGRFRVRGFALLDGYKAEDLDLFVDGVDLSYVEPKEYSVVVSPALRFRGTHLTDERTRKMMLSGDVIITEGQYSKSFDKFGKVIGGVRGRELDVYTEPLLDRMPWLGTIGFDLAVRGQNFEVLSRFPFGRTDLELGLDTRVRGTWAKPELYGRVEVMPGSLLTYSVVQREFEVTEGSIDFNGAFDKAWLSLDARAEITLEKDAAAAVSPTASVGPNLSSTGTGQANKVTVLVRVSGPLDDPRLLNIQLSSIPTYDPADIQSLVLTGQLNTSGSGGAIGSRSSINFLTEDIAAAFSKMLLSAFVDSVSIGIPKTGGINAKVTTSLGKAIQLTGTVYQDGSGVRDTSASVSIRLGEYWSLDGLLRSQPSSTSSSAGQNVNVYEAKLRYRVPLSE